MKNNIDIKKFKILGDKILVKVEKTNALHGLLVVPESSKDKPTYGTVIAIGDGKVGDKVHTIDLNINDYIMFKKWSSGHEIQDDYIILSFSDIIAVIKGEK